MPRNKNNIWNFLLKPFYGNSKNQHIDFKLLIIIFALLALGLLFLSSASSVVGFQDHDDSFYFFKKQLVNGVMLGLILFFIALKIPYHWWKKQAFWMLSLSIGLLLLVLIPGIGVSTGGATRWISLGFFVFQPSEIVKVTFLIYLATWLEKKGKKGLSDVEYGTIPFVTVMAVITFLFLKQPDMGTLIVLVASSFLIYFIAGAPWRHIISISGIGIALLVVLIIATPYRAERFQTFLSGGDSLDTGYHISQAKIAIGSGGLFGLGLGHSKQKFRYLPEVQGDSIFAIIAEEMGFIISTGIILLFVALLIRGFKVARNSPDEFGRLLASGITIWFVIQAMINLGAMMGLLPLTGIPLPFISYGGSALAMSLFGVGILLNISKYSSFEK